MPVTPVMSVVAAGGGRWHLGIGDPDAVAWCIVGAYAVAVGCSAWACVMSVRGAQLLVGVDDREAQNQRTLARVWFVVAVVMLALGINKQLDLQTWFLQTMRRKAYEGGWYDDRRRYQQDVIVGAMLLGAVGAAALAYLLRRVLLRILVTIAGLAMLVLFVVIRAISFHYVDYVLRMGGRLGVNAVLELSGIMLIVASTILYRHHERDRPDRARAAAIHRRQLPRPERTPVPAASGPGSPS